MKVFTPEISWHQKEPVFSVDFCKSTWRLASGGADFTVKIWHVKEDPQGNIGLDFMANLDRHSKPVNVVRFSPDGKLLASAGDDCIIIIWKLAEDGEQKPNETMIGCEEICNKETWTVHKMLRRGHLEDIYDLAWSPDGQQLISGSVDNSAIIWDVNKGQFTNIIKDHKHYVQGVCWDPRGQYVATHSSDRSCKIYSLAKNRCIKSIDRATFPVENASEDEPKSRTCKIFMDETMQSFFRRCTFSPDGLLLVLPGGLTYVEEKPKKATYAFARGNFNKPALCLPGPKKATVGACFCPIAFENVKNSLNKENGQPECQEMFKLPYRLCYAISTLDSVVFYDTQHHYPFGYVSGVHYASLTDMTWSSDGRVLVVSSLDGYCSLITFKDGELGKPIDFDLMEFVKSKMKARKEAKKEAKNIQPTKPVPASPVVTVLEKDQNVPSCSAAPQCPAKDQATLLKFLTPVRKRKRTEGNDSSPSTPTTPSGFKGNGTSDSPYELTNACKEPIRGIRAQSHNSSQSEVQVPKPSIQSPSTTPKRDGHINLGFDAKTPKTPTEKEKMSKTPDSSPAGRPKSDAPQPRRVSFTTLNTNRTVDSSTASTLQQSSHQKSQLQSKKISSESLKSPSTDPVSKAPRRIQLTSLSVKRDHSGETKPSAPGDMSNAPLPVPVETSLITGSAGSTPPKGSPKQARRVSFVTLSSPKFEKETETEPEIGMDMLEGGHKTMLDKTSVVGTVQNHPGPAELGNFSSGQEAILGSSGKIDVKECTDKGSSVPGCTEESREAKKDSESVIMIQEGQSDVVDGKSCRIPQPFVSQSSSTKSHIPMNFDNCDITNNSKSELKTPGTDESQSQKQEATSQQSQVDDKTDNLNKARRVPFITLS